MPTSYNEITCFLVQHHFVVLSSSFRGIATSKKVTCIKLNTTNILVGESDQEHGLAGRHSDIEAALVNMQQERRAISSSTGWYYSCYEMPWLILQIQGLLAVLFESEAVQFCEEGVISKTLRIHSFHRSPGYLFE
jgi:hypothetical protein